VASLQQTLLRPIGRANRRFGPIEAGAEIMVADAREGMKEWTCCNGHGFWD